MDSKQELRCELALSIAKYAHHNQKYGEHDYFEHHIMGVAGKFERGTDEWLVAVLHDVIEDSDITVKALEHFFRHNIVLAVSMVTRTHEQKYDDYIDHICGLMDYPIPSGVMAIRVKEADLEFNIANNPPDKLRERYEKALTKIKDRLGE